MKLFDAVITEVISLLASHSVTHFESCPAQAAPEGDPNELILRRDMAFELGEGSFPAVSLTAITQDALLVPQDGVYLCGPDLHEIEGDCAFARVTLLRTDDVYQSGDQAAYNLIKNLETQKFRTTPQGYQMRPSALSNREQVRVSRQAVRAGLRFEHVGNLLIQKFRENRHVQAVAILFLTLPVAPYRGLDRLADRVTEIARTLNHALMDISMDCHACEWKPVCDAVDGIRKLHQDQIQRKEETM